MPASVADRQPRRIHVEYEAKCQFGEIYIYMQIYRYIYIYTPNPTRHTYILVVYVFGSGGHWEHVEEQPDLKTKSVILIWDKAKSVCSQNELFNVRKTPTFECDNGRVL